MKVSIECAKCGKLFDNKEDAVMHTLRESPDCKNWLYQEIAPGQKKRMRVRSQKEGESCHNCKRWGPGECQPSLNGGHYYDRLTIGWCPHYSGAPKKQKEEADGRLAVLDQFIKILDAEGLYPKLG